MGLFSKDKTPSAEELAAREVNREKLECFNMTRSWGIKKYATATQFIYDEEMKAFVVVEGPDESFKEREPWVIDFDEVEDAWLEVDEWWSKEGKQFDKYHDYHRLLQEDYKNVFWHYDLYMNIKTKHEYAGTIRYKMNYRTNILKVPGFSFFVHRGLELSGEFRGREIKEQSEKLESFCDKIKGNVKNEKTFDILTHRRPDSIADRLKEDLTDEWYISRIENVDAHVKRAYRISALLGVK